MRVIPVLDVMRGVAVHARGGDRSRYAPVRSVLSHSAADPLLLAAAYREALGATELYVADLDAIQGGEPSAVVRALCVAEHRIWLDAGASDAVRARATLACGAAHVVIGLETLPSQKDLEEIVRAVGVDRAVFSLDLRGRTPMTRRDADLPHELPELCVWADSTGIRRFIVLDLSRVGSADGADVVLLSDVREWLPRAELVAGGGIRDARDLDALAAAGYDGALVATALHEGRVTRADVQAALGARTHSRGGK